MKNLFYINGLSNFLYSIRCQQFRETQEAFGARCQLSQKTISRLENTARRRMITLDSLCSIAKGIGVFPSQLLAQNERLLTRQAPEEMNDYNRCLKHYDQVIHDRDDAMDNLMKMLQASLMIYDLIHTKGLNQITDEDIHPIFVIFQGFFQK